MSVELGAASASRLERLREQLDALPLCRDLRIEVLELGEGRARASIATPPELRHPGGIIPGVYLTALIDATTSFAVQTLLAEEERHATTDLSVHFVRAATDLRLTAASSLIERGRRRAFARCEVTDEAGRLCAVATGTWAISPRRGSAGENGR
jgi:uncharacterized protein (TIGR00369 family)